ncbi:MAG: hypothetical protein ABSE68_02055 [Minisyncoccia bacterium]
MRRVYRILAIAIIFFVAGIFFFYKDKNSEVSDAPKVSDYKNLQVVGDTSFQDPLFSKFPSPDKFQKFTYDKIGINGGDSFLVSAQCVDAFLTVLIFPSVVDYRKDVAKAVFNKAFGCAAGEKFNHEVVKSDLANYGFGSYYVILADQGRQGMWYNPR